LRGGCGHPQSCACGAGAHELGAGRARGWDEKFFVRVTECSTYARESGMNKNFNAVFIRW